MAMMVRGDGNGSDRGADGTRRRRRNRTQQRDRSPERTRGEEAATRTARAVLGASSSQAALPTPPTFDPSARTTSLRAIPLPNSEITEAAGHVAHTTALVDRLVSGQSNNPASVARQIQFGLAEEQVGNLVRCGFTNQEYTTSTAQLAQIREMQADLEGAETKLVSALRTHQDEDWALGVVNAIRDSGYNNINDRPARIVTVLNEVFPRPHTEHAAPPLASNTAAVMPVQPAPVELEPEEVASIASTIRMALETLNRNLISGERWVEAVRNGSKKVASVSGIDLPQLEGFAQRARKNLEILQSQAGDEDFSRLSEDLTAHDARLQSWTDDVISLIWHSGQREAICSNLTTTRNLRQTRFLSRLKEWEQLASDPRDVEAAEEAAKELFEEMDTVLTSSRSHTPTATTTSTVSDALLSEAREHIDTGRALRVRTKPGGWGLWSVPDPDHERACAEFQTAYDIHPAGVEEYLADWVDSLQAIGRSSRAAQIQYELQSAGTVEAAPTLSPSQYRRQANLRAFAQLMNDAQQVRTQYSGHTLHLLAPTPGTIRILEEDVRRLESEYQKLQLQAEDPPEEITQGEANRQLVEVAGRLVLRCAQLDRFNEEEAWTERARDFASLAITHFKNVCDEDSASDPFLNFMLALLAMADQRETEATGLPPVDDAVTAYPQIFDPLVRAGDRLVRDGLDDPLLPYLLLELTAVHPAAVAAVIGFTDYAQVTGDAFEVIRDALAGMGYLHRDFETADLPFYDFILRLLFEPTTMQRSAAP